MADDSPTLQTAPERKALGAATHYARVHDLGTPAEQPYLDALGQAGRDIRDRLVLGLLRGSPDGLPAPRTVESEAGESATVLPESACPFDASVDVPTGDHDRIAVLALPASDRVLSVPVLGEAGYDRIHVGDPVTLAGPTGLATVTHPVDLVGPLEREGAFVDAEQCEVVRAELAESVANLALALLAERVQAARAPESVLDATAEEVPAADRPAYMERLVTRGHPFHPAAKIRRGMSPAEGLAYAPEFASTIHLRFAAVRADVARRTAVNGRTLTDRLLGTFDGLDAAAAGAVPGDRSEYALIPVHPWQYHHVLPERYASQVHDGRVVPIEEYSIRATPLLNLRTVVPEGDEPRPHCKLPIAVQTTNVERTLSPQAVHNGPRTTRLWRTIAERDSFETLGLLEESAAASYYPPDGPHTAGDSYDDARHLAALVRQNPRTHHLVSEAARVVPAASLVARTPDTGRPLVESVIERFAGSDGGDDDNGTESFLRAYAETVVAPQLRLLSTYGVALESHLQNCVVVFEDWRPVGVLVRDFGGIRIHQERLAEHDITFEPYPDSDLDTDGDDDLHRKLYYALFQNHLAELVATLVRVTPVDAATCWNCIRSVCRATFDRLRTDSKVDPATVETDEAALFTDPIPFKALTAMRLQGKRHEYVTSQVSNPLGECDAS
ncbi:MAG: siderophore synthetase component [Haloarculaceae archaeon]|jgi:siderophore synthetase component